MSITISRDSRRPARPIAILMTAAAATALLVNLASPARADDQIAQGAGATVLEPISVTAHEVAPGGYQIGTEELDRANALNIKDVFRGEAGVQVGGGADTARKSYVNGLEDSNLDVKIDDARQIGTTFHHLGTAIIDPSLLKSVRIETGVAPADVGPATLGGSIAYETKDARDILNPGQALGGQARMVWESDTNLYNPNLTVAGQSQGVEAMVHTSYNNGGNYHDGADREVVGSAPQMKSFLGKAAYTSQSGQRFELNSSFLQDDHTRPNRVNFGTVSAGATAYPPAPYLYRRKSVGVTYKDEAPTGMINPEVVLSYNQILLDIDTLRIGPAATAVDVGSLTTSYSGKLANTFTTNLGIAQSGSVTTGIDFYRDEGRKTHTTAAGAGRAGVWSELSKNVGMFAQARLKMTNDLRLSFGGRFDQQWFTGIDGTDLDTSGASANMNAEYDIVDGLTGYAGIGTSFGGIPLGESMIYNFSGVWKYDGLQASRSHNYKAGFKGEQGPFSGDIHAFVNRIMDSHERGDATRAAHYNIVSKGINVTGKYTYGDGFLRATFSTQDLRANGEILRSGSVSYHGFNLGEMMTLEAAHAFPEWGVRVGATGEMAMRNDDNEQQPWNGYGVFNIYAQWTPDQMAGVKLGDLTFRFDVRNLLDQTYVDRATAGNNDPAASGGTPTPYYQPGRTFLVTAKATF